MKSHGSQLVAFVLFSVLSLNLVFAAKSELIQEDVANTGNSSNGPVDGVSWIFPTSESSSEFNSVDTLNAQWQSTYTKPNLSLLCKAQDGPKFTSRDNFNVAQTGSRAILLDINQIAQTVICHLTLQDASNSTATSNSAPFTIAKSPNAAPQTWSANNPTAPTTSIATSELTAPTYTSSPSTSPAAPSNDPSVTGINSTHGLSTAAGVGIGIGVAVLVTLLALGILLLYLHMRQRRKNSEMQTGEASSSGHFRSSKASETNMMMKKKTIRVIPGIYETVGNRPVPQELDASASTFTRSPHGSVGSASVHQNSDRDPWSQRESDRSSTPGSIRGRIGEVEGLGGFI